MITTLQVPQQKRQAARRAVTEWTRPYYQASAGGEACMKRWLDDPDVPCYGPGWGWNDKNRFHQERAPGSAKKYVLNPDHWLYAFKDSMTCVSVANEYAWGSAIVNQNWHHKRGVTLITPQHIVSCAHAPIGFSTSTFPARVRFVGTDGEAYDRYLIGQKFCGGTRTVLVNGVLHAGDSWIATLNEPLPPEVVPARTIPNSSRFKSHLYSRWDAVFFNQSVESESKGNVWPTSRQDDFNPYGYSDYSAEKYHPHYPTKHLSMVVNFMPHAPAHFRYSVWAGDSGMPIFYAYGTELLWAGFVFGGGWGPSGYPTTVSGVTITWEDLVSAMIDQSDDHAISRGELAERTGYRCVFANEIPDLLPP